MRRAGLTVALAFAAFAAAEEAAPPVASLLNAGTTATINGEAADVTKALTNILIQTEDTKAASVTLGGETNPLALKVSNKAGPEAVVFVIPELKVAPSADKPAEGLGCYTIGDAANKVALLMCEGVNSDFTPAAKDGFEWVKGTITNKGTTDICQLNFASADLKLAGLTEDMAVPADLSKLTPFALKPNETKNYAFQVPIDSIKEGIPAIGIQDSLGPCGLIAQVKEAMAKQLAETEKAAADVKAAADAAAEIAQKAADALVAGAGEATDATKAAADEAAAATAKAAEEAATKAAAEAEALKAKMEEEAAVAKKAAEEAAAAAKVGEIKLNGEEEEAAKAEVTSPAPKMSASVMGLFTVAVLVAVQLLL